MNSRKDKVKIMSTTAIRSNTKVYCDRKTEFVPKYILVEIKADNGTRRYKLTHYSDRTEKFRTIDLDTPVIRARLRFMRDYREQQLMEQLDNGTLYLNLLRLNRDVEYAVDRQVMQWQDVNTEYLAANGDFLKQFALSQNFRMTAEHELYDAMVYV